MAITIANIAGSGNSGAAVSSITNGGTQPSATTSEYIIIDVHWYSVTGVGATGVGVTSPTMTWLQIGAAVSQDADGTNTIYVALFIAQGNGNTETVTADFTGGSTVAGAVRVTFQKIGGDV